MTSEWSMKPLGELLALQRGHDLPADSRTLGIVPVMGSAGITGFHNEATTVGPGVVIGRSGVGSMGVVSYIDRDYWALNTVLYVTDFRGNDVKFIYYLLRTINFRQFDTGSAQASLNRNLVYPHCVLVPNSKNEQIEIGKFLTSLDDRINLLRETNSTLEAIAQALFKSWFVDFDPVRAKMEGRLPEGMDEATAELFPDSFDDSESGTVPTGWRMGTVGDFARPHKGSINPLKNVDTLFEHFSLPAFDKQHMPVFELGTEIKSNKTSVPPDAVLLSKLNPHIPRVWLPFSVGKHAVCSTEFLAFVPVNSASREFIYCAFTTAKFKELLCQLVTGTSNSHQRVRPENVSTMNFVIPNPVLFEVFTDVVRPLFEKIGYNREAGKTLSALRDILLPRLISGQLRLPEAEAQIEAIAA